VKKILFYSPVGLWPIHAPYEIVLSRYLQAKGAEVRFVACDKQFSDCDVKKDCDKCVATSKRSFGSYDTPIDWLGNYLTQADREKAQSWAFHVPTHELHEAIYEKYPLGLWVRSSLHSYFRTQHLDLAIPNIEITYRKFLESAVISVFGLTRIFDSFKPDVLVELNGRFFTYRIAFELAQGRKIRVVTHELGYLSNTLQIGFNKVIHSLVDLRQIWTEYENLPLNREALLYVKRIIENRRYGKRLSSEPFSPVLKETITIRDRLKLDLRPIIAVLTSSTDEFAASDGWEQIFDTQFDWIFKTVQIAGENRDFQFVIRNHPNMANSRRAETEFLDRLHNLVSNGIPENVRVIWPEESISTYNLLDEAQAAITYFSITGLEMACLGKPVLTCSKGTYYGLSFVSTLEMVSEYSKAVTNLLRAKIDIEIARKAYRFAYHFFTYTSIPFPMVSTVHYWLSVIDITCLSGMEEGQDLSTKVIGDYILEGIPIDFSLIHGEWRSESKIAEDVFFSNESQLRLTRPKRRHRILFLCSDPSAFQTWLSNTYDPNLKRRSYDTQLRIRASTHVGEAHSYETALWQLGHEVHVIYVNNELFQKQWAHEQGLNMGNSWMMQIYKNPKFNQLIRIAKFTPTTTRLARTLLAKIGSSRFTKNKNWIRNILSFQIRIIQPDVIVNMATDQIDVAFLTQFRSKQTQKIIVFLPSTQEAHTWKKLNGYDLAFSDSKETKEKLKLLSFPSVSLAPAYDELLSQPGSWQGSITFLERAQQLINVIDT